MIELAPQPQQEITYDQAWLYCLTLDYDGYKDWRLPTNKEYNESLLIMNWYEDRHHILGEWGGRELHVTPVRTKDA